MAGQHGPTSGTVGVTGKSGFPPQNPTLDPTLRMDDVLGVADARATLHVIEAGDAGEHHLTALGEQWNVEEHAQVAPARLGLGHIGLDHTVGEVSGGEAVLLRLATLLLARPGVLPLDEPTDNVDRHARQ
nr:ATP-binding cassette domain-containing protein [Streptomyces sp. CBMA152]